MFFRSPKHSIFFRLHAVSRGCRFFCCKYTNIFFTSLLLFIHLLKILLRAVVSNSFVNCLTNGALWFKWLKLWILVQVFQSIKTQEGINGFQGFPNLHRAMLKCMVCPEPCHICVLKNTQIIFCSRLSPLYDIHILHNFRPMVP